MAKVSKRKDDYKNVINSIFFLMKNGIEQEIPKIEDAQIQSKVDYIYERLKCNSEYCDSVYAYFFIEQKSVYVGRTLYIKHRDMQHRTNKSSSVYKFADLHNTPIPQITILERFLTIEKGVQREKYYTEKFKKEGWNLINILPTGCMSNSTGNYCSEKWSFQKCCEEARKFKSVKDFKENSPKAYFASVRRGFIKEFGWLKGMRIFTARRVSYEECKEIALKYRTLKDFMKNDRSAYRFAKNKDWIKDFIWLKREKDYAKHVEQYTLDGVLLNTFDSVKQASVMTNVSYSIIYNRCNKGQKDGDKFIWKYKQMEA